MVTMAVEEESSTNKMRVCNKKSNLIVKAWFVFEFSQRKMSVAKKKNAKSLYASTIR